MFNWFLRACLEAIRCSQRREVPGNAECSDERVDASSNEAISVSSELRRLSKIARAFANQQQANYASKKTKEEDALRVAKWSVTWSAIAAVFAFLAALGTIASAFYAQRQFSEAQTDTEFQRQLNKVIFFVNFTTSKISPW